MLGPLNGCPWGPRRCVGARSGRSNLCRYLALTPIVSIGTPQETHSLLESLSVLRMAQSAESSFPRPRSVQPNMRCREREISIETLFSKFLFEGFVGNGLGGI